MTQFVVILLHDLNYLFSNILFYNTLNKLKILIYKLFISKLSDFLEH